MLKQTLLLILSVLIIVSLGFIIFGIFLSRFEEEKLLDDLQRKSKAVAESMELSARYVLVNKDLQTANYLVEKFGSRQRLQGCVIYDKDIKIVAITKKFSDWKQKDKSYLKEIVENKTAKGQLEKFKDYSVYSYILPILDDKDNLLGLVEVIYDTSYVFNRLTEMWKRITATLAVLIVLIATVILLIQWRIFILPIKRLTLWFYHFQKGETLEKYPFRLKGELERLVSEVEQVALSLKVARKTISDEASLRLKEELWTDRKLKDFILAKIGNDSFFVISNREPIMHILDEKGKIKCVHPPSGVVTAISPILESCGGTWIAHGAGNADKKFVNSKNKLGVPEKDSKYILKRVWLSKEEEKGYYYGFANEGLWPLCHNTHTRPIFRESDWRIYKEVNEKFCENLLEELPNRTSFVFIQDYHFTLLPKLIKEKRPDVIVALFWHIPWPSTEVFLICPYQKEILEGMLGADLIGFHTQSYCNNFLETANRLLESRIDTEKFSVIRQDKETFVRAFPISIDNRLYKIESNDKNKIENIKKEFNLYDKIIAVGVDRIDYTKGLIEKMLAVDRFLEKYPEYKNKFVLIQLAAPSRTYIKRYHDLISELEEKIEQINWKYQEADWKPIIYLKKYFSFEEIKPYYFMADLCIVSSLCDGMNLVAKEYIATKDNFSGMLILSRFTGAAKELEKAVLINPYSIEEFADSIKYAIQMPLEEKERRMKIMYENIVENNVYRWAANIVNELLILKKI